MLTAYSEKMEKLGGELIELGKRLSNASEELKIMLASGKVESRQVDDQLDWIWTLKRRRAVILNEMGLR